MVGAGIPAHALLETYSVLTRLPPPYRVASAVVQALLRRWFPAGRILVASAELQRDAVDRLQAVGVDGGAVYDGMVALTARAHGERLLTFDQRAMRTYEALGVEYELLDP